MTSLPHVFLCIDLNIDGKVVKGISSEGLPPKWFTKNSETSFEEDLPEMLTVLKMALNFSFLHMFGASLGLCTEDRALRDPPYTYRPRRVYGTAPEQAKG